MEYFEIRFNARTFRVAQTKCTYADKPSGARNSFRTSKPSVRYNIGENGSRQNDLGLAGYLPFGLGESGTWFPDEQALDRALRLQKRR